MLTNTEFTSRQITLNTTVIPLMKLNVRIPVSSCNEETVTRLDMVYELPHQATVTDEDLYNVASMSLLLLRENLVRNTVEKRQTPRKGGHHLSSLNSISISNCLNWKINCDDHSSLTSGSVRKWIVPRQ